MPRIRADSDWALEVARQADGDPTGWRDRARDPAIWKDEAALFKVIETAPFPEQSVALLLAIEKHSDAPEQDPRRVSEARPAAHPGDFWVNFRLGDMLMRAGKPEEAVGYYQAALAIRPGVAVIHNNLGRALIRDQPVRTRRSGIFGRRCASTRRRLPAI